MEISEKILFIALDVVFAPIIAPIREECKNQNHYLAGVFLT